MKQEEFKNIVKALRLVYTQPDFIPNKETFDMWFAMLRDLPYDVCSLVVQQYIQNNVFPPKIAEIRRFAADIIKGKQMTWVDSWSIVTKAIRKYGYTQQKEALESFDPLTAKCVKAIDFRRICESTNLDILRSQYQRIYESYLQQDQQERTLSLGLQNSINQLSLEYKKESNSTSLFLRSDETEKNQSTTEAADQVNDIPFH